MITINQHLNNRQRQTTQGKELMIKQSQKYIINEFNNHNLRLMGIHGDVL